ncbi:MAG: EAL domain-containing protein [Gammaproteobacteria bacterium]
MREKPKIKLLLLEDNAGDVRLIMESLSHDCPGKYDITTADRITKGIELLKDHDFDVVLTEMSLPDSGESGSIDIIQDAYSGLPLVVLSSDEGENLAAQIVKSGAQDYLVKGQGDGHLVDRAIRYAIERKQIEQGLSYLTRYDALTGLANRLLCRERLSRALIRADRNESLIALMFIDLDRFKNINNILGHDAGDKLLIEAGNRMRSCIREGDTIARPGGDEFTIILEGIKQVDDAATVADKIMQAMVPAFNLDGQDVYVTPSIGITIYPLDGRSENSLLKNADAAMYRAKEQGRNGFQFYTAGMNTKTIKRLELEAELRQALVNNEFVLYYQPRVDIDSGEIIGVEALIRWRRKEHGLVSPLEFIPLAEETGLIVPIGEWAIRTACRQISTLQSAGFDHLCMSVNLSARQFRESDVVKTILESAIHASIEPENIDIEITESMLMDDTEASNTILKQLKEHGLSISIDDFGTGYCSLSYLKRFNIDTLKIDQSFVRDITTSPDDAAMVAAIISLGRSLRLTVVAEGVETEEQLVFLKANGCHEAQGFLFGKPLSSGEFIRLLEQRNRIQSREPVVRLA